jgi:cyclopropane-fatty-acyl-phospholipid synthase
MAHDSTAARLRALLTQLLQTPVPVRIRAWDNSEAGPPDAPTLWLRHRRALRRLIWQPNELGLARAYVAGELALQGDLFDALTRLAEFIWPAGAGTPPKAGAGAGLGAIRAAAVELARLGALGPQPRPPSEETTVRGVLHSLRRDRQAISHHYDVGNDFYRIVLGESMVYSCAYWTSAEPAYGLADAQRDKLELICRKLDLRAGSRLLDVGCGWGGLAVHAAREYGASVLGITVSHEQSDYARKQVAEAGLTDRVEIRLQDYRTLDDGPFDAIASIGMAEHVGSGPYRDYARILFQQLRPGGRLLNHQISARTRRLPTSTPSFIDRYVFPDGDLIPLGTTVSLLEDAGLEVRDVEALREHYGRTLRSWVANLEAGWADAVRLAGAGRARVWRLYLAASALAFERGHLGVNQVLAVKSQHQGPSGLPPTRTWLA